MRSSSSSRRRSGLSARGCSSATLIALLALLVVPSPAGAAFGFKDIETASTNADGSAAIQAGSHPFAFTTSFDVNTVIKGGKEFPAGDIKNLRIDLPPGFVGDPRVVPRCSDADFLSTTDAEGTFAPFGACPDSSAVGTVRAHAPGESGGDPGVIFNLVPPPGTVAKLGFHVLGVPVTVLVGIDPAPPYNAFASLQNVSNSVAFGGSVATLWGNPADSAHDEERGKCFSAVGKCPANIPERPFLTLPRSCTGPLETLFGALSWQGDEAEGEGLSLDGLEPPSPIGLSGCAKLGFGPSITAQPTTADAESPSGLDVNVEVNDEGLTSPSGIAQSDIEKAVVTLPEGVTINPSQAEGLQVCTEEDLERETVDSQFGEGCPAASKVGTVETESPLLEGEIFKGSVFVAAPYENPTGSLIAIYTVIKDPELGILIELPAKVEPDPKTGQLITTFGEEGLELPQLPISHFHFHFREGGRSPLVTPAHCGTYETEAEFTPWANPQSPFTTTASFQVSAGPGGGPCPPGGIPPFKPGFTAGSIDNTAASYSPFYMRLTRQDGEQDMTRFSAVLPPGMIGKLAGVTKCSDAAIAAAKARTGPHGAQEELERPSCPAASKIGRVLTGAGVGSELTYVPGSVYLAGPVGHDPLSVVGIVPAVAGPFDVGTVVAREALTLNPDTAEVEVDGSASDPIPHILKGIVLKVRDLRVYADRPNFTLNPTNCESSLTKATLFGSFLDVFNPADDVPVSLADRFQAADCAVLGFRPKLSLNLKGGTKRGDHPALKAVVTPRAGDANFKRAVVTLPHSAFLEQAHIRTICTRVQFAAHGGNGAGCPAGAVYGQARAWSPLLEEVLEGPVYLRSSSHNLPDLVVALHGLVNITLASRIDSQKGGIRSSFESIPDAPVSRFILEMQGGKKGLIVNSTNLCAGKHRAKANLKGQNGKRYDTKPLVRADCGKGHKKHVAHHKRRHG